MINKTT